MIDEHNEKKETTFNETITESTMQYTTNSTIHQLSQSKIGNDIIDMIMNENVSQPNNLSLFTNIIEDKNKTNDKNKSKFPSINPLQKNNHKIKYNDHSGEIERLLNYDSFLGYIQKKPEIRYDNYTHKSATNKTLPITEGKMKHKIFLRPEKAQINSYDNKKNRKEITPVINHSFLENSILPLNRHMIDNYLSNNSNTVTSSYINEEKKGIQCYNCKGYYPSQIIISCSNDYCKKNFCRQCLSQINENNIRLNGKSNLPNIGLNWICYQCTIAEEENMQKQFIEPMKNIFKGDQSIEKKKRNEEEYDYNKLLENKDKCESFYIRKYDWCEVKKKCYLCFNFIQHSTELLRFETFDNCIQYLYYWFNENDTLLTIKKENIKKNKDCFMSYYYKVYKSKKKNNKMGFYRPKIMCKLCFMKVLNGKNFLSLFKRLKDRKTTINRYIKKKDRIGIMNKITKKKLVSDSEENEEEEEQEQEYILKNNENKAQPTRKLIKDYINHSRSIDEEINQFQENTSYSKTHFRTDSFDNEISKPIFKESYTNQYPLTKSINNNPDNPIIPYSSLDKSFSQQQTDHLLHNNNILDTSYYTSFKSLNDPINKIFSVLNDIIDDSPNSDMKDEFNEVTSKLKINIDSLSKIIAVFIESKNTKTLEKTIYVLEQKMSIELKELHLVFNQLTLWLNNQKNCISNLQQTIKGLQSIMTKKDSNYEWFKRLKNGFLIEYERNKTLSKQYTSFIEKCLYLFKGINNLIQKQKNMIDNTIIK